MYHRFQTELPSAVMKRDPRHVTRDELVKLMEWKLTVGLYALKSLI